MGLFDIRLLNSLMRNIVIPISHLSLEYRFYASGGFKVSFNHVYEISDELLIVTISIRLVIILSNHSNCKYTLYSVNQYDGGNSVLCRKSSIVEGA